jgi:hypothetical protein
LFGAPPPADPARNVNILPGGSKELVFSSELV